jgi:hypothetical protein
MGMEGMNPHTNLMEIGMPRVLPPTTMYRSNIPAPTHPGPWRRIWVHFGQQSSNEVVESLSVEATMVYLIVEIAVDTHSWQDTPSL